MSEIEFLDADEEIRDRVFDEWGEVAARHMHLADGFSVVAVDGGAVVGLVSVQWRDLPPPLELAREGFVEIIEVAESHRRRGIAARMLEMCLERAREEGAHQLRAWSSEDKAEAIPMWRALGFGMHPATERPRGSSAVKGYFVTRVV